ncbi:MAG: penicillin acylase family protein [Terriglobia bacterium]
MMTRGGKLLLTLLILLLLGVLLPVGWFAWRAWRALPPYDGEIQLSGLRQPVRILRDPRAVPHIYARNLEDLFLAQGYVHAQERLWQMDLLRRTARGELSEIFGRGTLRVDKENRRLGLGAVADRAADALEDDTRRQLEAYARGVNAFIDSHRGNPLTARLPIEFALLHYQPDPWQPADSLAIGLSMFKLLYNRWRTELARAQVEERVGPERAADLFVSRSEDDHPIAEPVKRRRLRRPRVFVAHSRRHWLEELLAEGAAGSRRRGGASNNWVVAGAHTASGAAMLANDTHLPHSVPSIWFINHLKSPQVDVAGFSLPGIPWVIIGHNQRIAWGITNLMADTQDLFIERFNPDDPSRYMTPTGWQTVQRRMEHIAVRGSDDVDFEVLETRHGPIVRDDGDFKLALQWTARDLGALTLSFLGVNQAQNWEEFTRALRDYGGPPQNFVYADAEGNIGYHAAGRIPLRRRGRGQLPVPGDSNQFDWIGYVPFEGLPQAFNPPEGVLATANNRVVPDDYPYHLTDDWIAPARIARIYQLLKEEIKFTPEDFLRIQGDILSLPDRFLAKQLRAAGAKLGPHPPKRAQALAMLADWEGSMRADSPAPLLTVTTRTRLLEELLRPHLGDAWRSYSWLMAPVFLEKVLWERPARWLPENYPSYDALLLAGLDRALEQLQRETRVASVARLRWGEQMRVRFRHPVGRRVRLLRRWLSVGGAPQAGGRYSVKQTGRTYGPSQRLVVDFADLDATRMNITLGQSGHVASSHYKDQFSAWLEMHSFPAPFTDAGVQRATRHTLRLRPR